MALLEKLPLAEVGTVARRRSLLFRLFMLFTFFAQRSPTLLPQQLQIERHNNRGEQRAAELPSLVEEVCARMVEYAKRRRRRVATPIRLFATVTGGGRRGRHGGAGSGDAGRGGGQGGKGSAQGGPWDAGALLGRKGWATYDS